MNVTVSVRLPEELAEKLGEAENASAVVREALRTYFAQKEGELSLADQVAALRKRVKKLESSVECIIRPYQ